MVHFWHGLQEGPVLNSFKQIVVEYNASHDTKVELKGFTDYGQPVRDALANPEEEQPTLVLAPEFQTALMKTALKEGRVLPIGSLLTPEKLDTIADIVKKTFGDAEGNLAALPMNPSCGVLFMNLDMLHEANIDPSSLTSIEALEAACKKLKKGWTSAWPAAYLVEVPAAQQNKALVEPLNGKLGHGTYKLASPWLVEHIKDLRKQQAEGVYLYAGRKNDAKNPFIERKVAFFMQGSTHQPILEKEASFKVGAAPLPTLTRNATDKYAFPMGGAAIWVLNNKQTSAMIGQVREFLNYLASKEVQERWHKETAYVPVNKELAVSLQDFYKDHPLHKAVLSQTIEAKVGEHSFGIHAPNWSTAREELFALLETLLDTKTTDDEIEPLLKAFDDKYSILR